MAIDKSLVLSVSQTQLGRDKRQATALEQLEIVGPARAHSRTDNLMGLKLHHQLRF